MTSTSIYNIWFQHILFSPLTDHQKAFSFSKNALPSFQITVNHSKSKWSGIMIKFCNLTVLSQQNSWKISSIIFPWLKSVSSPSFQFPYIFFFLNILPTYYQEINRNGWVEGWMCGFRKLFLIMSVLSRFYLNLLHSTSILKSSIL